MSLSVAGGSHKISSAHNRDLQKGDWPWPRTHRTINRQ
jgi:hypothetical protein